jgi:hypothetical protein
VILYRVDEVTTVGVPLRVPVDVFKVKPVGRDGDILNVQVGFVQLVVVTVIGVIPIETG